MHGNDRLSRDSGPSHFEPNPPGVFLRVAGVVAVSFWLASYLPAALIPLAMSQFLSVGALAAATMALLLREPVSEPRITRWDEAATLFAVSLLAGLFVDPGSAAATLQSLYHATGHGAALASPSVL